jgi:CO/xanthine dehydrogenase Mo-binding subunit
MDILAEQMEIDPLEFRLINALRAALDASRQLEDIGAKVLGVSN